MRVMLPRTMGTVRYLRGLGGEGGGMLDVGWRLVGLGEEVSIS